MRNLLDALRAERIALSCLVDSETAALLAGERGCFGCGSSSAPSSSTTTSSLPPQVLQAYQGLTAQAQNVAGQPLQQYAGPTVAGFTPAQTAAFDTVNNAQGVANPFINAASEYAANSTAPIINQVQGFSPANVQQYESPYTSDVVNATEAQFANTNAQQQAQLTSQAAAQGALGGDRQGVAQGILAGQQQLSEAPTIAGLENQGYTQALGELNTQQQTQLNAAEANAWLNSQAGFAEGNLGNEAQNSALTGAQAQLATGNLEQQQAQTELNVPYEQFLQAQAYPFQTTGWLGNLVEGLGGSQGGTSSTTSQTPGPSQGSQIAGDALTAAALVALAARGGRIRPRYDAGGFVSGFNPGKLPDVPDVSVSIIPQTGGASYPGSSIPHSSTPQSQPDNSTANSMQTIQALSALKKLYGGNGIPGVGGAMSASDLGTIGNSAAAGSTDAMLPSASAFGDMMGASGFGLEGAGAAGAAGALGGDAGMADIALAVMARGGRLRRDSGGGVTGLQDMEELQALTALANAQSQFRGGPVRLRRDIGGSIPGVGPAMMPGMQPGMPTAPLQTPGVTRPPVAGMAQAPSPMAAAGGNPLASAAQDPQMAAALKMLLNPTGRARGGNVAGFADGGSPAATAAFAGQAASNALPPGQTNYLQNLSSLPVEKLQELAARVPPSTQQGQMIQRAITMKRMMPTSQADPNAPQAAAAPAAAAAPSPTAPTAGFGNGQGGLGLATQPLARTGGRISGFATGGAPGSAAFSGAPATGANLPALSVSPGMSSFTSPGGVTVPLLPTPGMAPGTSLSIAPVSNFTAPPVSQAPETPITYPALQSPSATGAPSVGSTTTFGAAAAPPPSAPAGATALGTLSPQQAATLAGIINVPGGASGLQTWLGTPTGENWLNVVNNQYGGISNYAAANGAARGGRIAGFADGGAPDDDPDYDAYATNAIYPGSPQITMQPGISDADAMPDRGDTQFTPHHTDMPDHPQSGFADSPWLGVMAAGLGMMSGRSPYAAVNIGQGGIEGLKVLGEQQNRFDTEKSRQQTIDQESDRLSQSATQHQQDLDARNAQNAREAENSAARNKIDADRNVQLNAYQTGELGLHKQEAADTAAFHEAQANQGQWQYGPGPSADDQTKTVPGSWFAPKGGGAPVFYPGAGAPKSADLRATTAAAQGQQKLNQAIDKSGPTVRQWDGTANNGQGAWSDTGVPTTAQERVDAQATAAARKSVTFLGNKPDDPNVGLYLDKTSGAVNAGPAVAAKAGTAGADPARIREADQLVKRNVAPDFTTAYSMVRAGVNDQAQWQREVEAEKKTLAGTPRGMTLDPAQLEREAQENVVARAAAQPQRVPAPAPVAQPAPAPTTPSTAAQPAAPPAAAPAQPKPQAATPPAEPRQQKTAPVAPPLPPGLPPSAQWSPSTNSFWWQENGKWLKAPAQ